MKFERTISESEWNFKYLNLSDDDRNTYGSDFPKHKEPMLVVTGGKKYPVKKHKSNQIWTGLKDWYSDQEIMPGDRILIEYDPYDKGINERFVLYIEILERAEDNDMNEEIPQAVEISIQMEEVLEDFLIENLQLIEEDLELYNKDQDKNGRQYHTDIGRIDLLCVNDDEFVVIELKKGKSSDRVVGQISRYIGWVKENLANGKKVRGIIIVHDYNEKLKYAVSAHDNIQLEYYGINIEFISEDEAIKRMGLE